MFFFFRRLTQACKGLQKEMRERRGLKESNKAREREGGKEGKNLRSDIKTRKSHVLINYPGEHRLCSD
jgi:hypothetical protein